MINGTGVIAIVAKRNLAPAPSECWIVANSIVRLKQANMAKAVVR